jgi:hypothetical protein
VIFDFRYRNAEGKWKALGHRKGQTRDQAFASWEEKEGGIGATEFMSRPRDGRSRSWDLFRRPGEDPEVREPGRVRERFFVICKAELDQRVIAKLTEQGVYCRPRSEPDRGARHIQHFLSIDALSGTDAVKQARQLLRVAGGAASELRLLGPNAVAPAVSDQSSRAT